MNFPEAPRGQAFPLSRNNVGTSNANLNATSAAKRMELMRSSISLALARDAERWIFQPCWGSTVREEEQLNQMPRRLISQPEGSFDETISWKSASWGK